MLADIIVTRSGLCVIEHGLQSFKAQCQTIKQAGLKGVKYQLFILDACVTGKDEQREALLNLAQHVCGRLRFDQILVEATSTAYTKLVCFTFGLWVMNNVW